MESLNPNQLTNRTILKILKKHVYALELEDLTFSNIQRINAWTLGLKYGEHLVSWHCSIPSGSLGQAEGVERSIAQERILIVRQV